MSRTKLAWKILKKVNLHKIILIYIVVLITSAIILKFVDPNIPTVPDGLWYLYVSFTTIGYGDIVVSTHIGRIITVIVSLFGIYIVTLITSVLINYYQELNKLLTKESRELILDKLERLPELSKEELKEISKNLKNKINK